MQWPKQRQHREKFRNPRLCAMSIKRCVSGFSCLLLLACGTAPHTSGGAADTALSIIGLKRTDKDVPTKPRLITLRIESARDMNSGGTAQGVPTVLRLYKLRTYSGFLSAPQHAFGDPEKERIAFGPDLVEVRELTLMPGQSLRANEALPGDARHLGVVALFRRPSGQRWRMAFTARDIEESGLILGVHACAFTATGAVPIGMARSDALLLSTAQCIQ